MIWLSMMVMISIVWFLFVLHNMKNDLREAESSSRQISLNIDWMIEKQLKDIQEKFDDKLNKKYQDYNSYRSMIQKCLWDEFKDRRDAIVGSLNFDYKGIRENIVKLSGRLDNLDDSIEELEVIKSSNMRSIIEIERAIKNIKQQEATP